MPVSPADNYPASSGVQDGVITHLANLQQTGIWKSCLATDDLLLKRLQGNEGPSEIKQGRMW